MTFSEWDFHVFQAINGLADNVSFLNPVMQFFAEYALYLFVVGIVFFWFTRSAGNRQLVVYTVISACVAVLLAKVLGQFFHHVQPFATHQGVNQLIPHEVDNSFPSDHATVSFVIAATFWLFHKRARWIWLLLAASIAFSRIWVGVHYPSDVLTGFILGTLTAVVIFIVLSKWGAANTLLRQLVNLYERGEERVWPRKTGADQTSRSAEKR